MSVIFSHHNPSIFTLFYGAFILSCINAAPAPVGTFYSEFISQLSINHCKMPEEVVIPFSENSDPNAFDYLSTSLHICQTTKAEMENDGAHILCKEIFQVLQNITCVDYTNAALPQINSSRFSGDVCNNFFDLRDALPTEKEYISGKLVDNITCTVLCSREYAELCKILVWSYDVQVQIRKAIEGKAKEEENTDAGDPINKDSNMKIQFGNNSEVEQHPGIAKTSSENMETKLSDGSKVAPKQINENKNIHNGMNSNDVNYSILSNSKNPVSVLPSSVLPEQLKKDSTIVSHQKDTTNFKPNNSGQSEKGINPTGVDEEINEPNIDMQSHELLDLNKKSNDDDDDLEEGEEKDNIKAKEQSINDQPLKENTSQKADNLLAAEKEGKHDQSEKSDLSQSSNTNKDVTDSKNDQINENSVDRNPSDNEPKQENENTVKEKLSSSKNLDVVTKSKSTEKTKETEAVISNVGSSDTSDLTTMQITTEKNDEDQAQNYRDQEPFNDTENESDYSKDYDNQSAKDKDSEVKNSISITSKVSSLNEISNNFDTFLNHGNNLGSVRDDVQIVPDFPDQEDSHFFFYFLSIVLILMAGYLIFHNKQKIIALIVEGRHERRRRSHGAGYKKLETK